MEILVEGFDVISVKVPSGHTPRMKSWGKKVEAGRTMKRPT